ncbi:hypothetical protein K458DRAFT_401524 [Lentithecium fluviatile CBS 122367]|uniref:Uncharacterized protein n=1 Tax=Lentithecium fluviatile CBS 122367 TaxID=1168545 RepID=A0A6G1JD92_9PLEO|nr:hypothetical protein K458DRAFT_401524 [Lentithecium fluviatile CBS 122367]
MSTRRRSVRTGSISADEPEFDPLQYTAEGIPINRDWTPMVRPENPATDFWVDEKRVQRNRHADMPEQAKAMADAVDYGFKDIDRTPLAPTAHPGYLHGWTRPKFPTDQERREELTQIFIAKLKLARDLAIEEINANGKETKDSLLKRKKTSDRPIAQQFADPNQPMPIPFQAQDLIRLFLCEVGTIKLLETASNEDKSKEGWKRTYKWAQIHRDQRWQALANILQLQLPGEERARKNAALGIMGDLLLLGSVRTGE